MKSSETAGIFYLTIRSEFQTMQNIQDVSDHALNLFTRNIQLSNNLENVRKKLQKATDCDNVDMVKKYEYHLRELEEASSRATAGRSS